MQRIGRGGGGCYIELAANPCVSRENGHKMTVVFFFVFSGGKNAAELTYSHKVFSMPHDMKPGWLQVVVFQGLLHLPTKRN